MNIRESGIKLPKNAWLIVGLLFIVGTLNYLDRTMITTMRASIISSIPMTEAQFGLLTSIFLWVYGFLSPFAGFIADRFNRSRVIIGSLFAWSAVTWMTGHATTYEELLIARALMGVSEAFYIPAALALIVDYHKGPTQSLATGINLAGVMLGQCLGFIGGWLAESYSWNFAFNLLGIIGIVYSGFLIFFLKDIREKEPNKKEKDIDKKKPKSNTSFIEAFKVLFTRKAFICLFFAVGIMGVVSWMVVGWLPTFYMEKFNLSQTTAGVYATTYLYPASIAGLLLGGLLSDRWSLKNPQARVLVPIIGLSIAAPFVFLASKTDILVLTITFFLIYGLFRMFLDTNLMPTLCLIIDSRYRATGYGVLNMLSTIIGGVGIYAAGLLRDSHINLSLIFQLASVVILVCIGLLFIIKRQIKK